MLPNFYYHRRMMAYDFGPGHPLKPVRLQRTLDLLSALGPIKPIDPGVGDAADVLRVHDADYVEGVRRLSEMARDDWRDPDVVEWAIPFGFGSLDNPPFPGIYQAALAYVAGSAAAARA